MILQLFLLPIMIFAVVIAAVTVVIAVVIAAVTVVVAVLVAS